jgi:predicted acylesterase/phospholipase RssA
MTVQPPPARRRSLLGLAAGGAAALALAAWSFPTREPAVPRGGASRATVLGLPNERFFPTEAAGQAALQQEFIAAVQRQLAARGLPPTAPTPDLDLLGISGGGENGAFGAGLLNGWTERGGRPDFFLVTGISTGALSAPFAFLGSAWDEPLKRVYTEITLADVIVQRGFTAAIWDDGMADNSPLFRTISRYIDEAMLAELARAHAGGRLLLIGTSNLDAQMPVIWNIGAIAGSGHPKALDTIRRILLASSAIPGAFSPVLFDVTLDGKPFQELHVDGGAFAQVFLYPASVSQLRRERIAQRKPVAPARAWVIRNGRLDPEWASVDRRTVGIAGRAVASMISAAGYQDVWRIYYGAERDGVDSTWPISAATSPWNTTSPSTRPICARCMSMAGNGRWRAMPG